MRVANWLSTLASAATYTAIAICAASMPAMPQSGAGGVTLSCRIEVSHSDGLFGLRAIARSDIAVSGSYQFSIDKQNVAGSAVNQQSGSFDLMPGKDKVLATVMLEAAAQGHYSANLTLTWQAGTTSCRSP